MMGIQPNLLNQLVSLLLGASVAGVLIFFMSSDGIGAGPSTAGISSWVNGTMAVPVAPAQEANHTSASKVDVASPQEANHNTSQVSKTCDSCSVSYYL